MPRQEYKLETNTGGCPCNETCCKEPKIITPEHECSDEQFCEECYGSECENCGDTCYCEL